PLIAIKRFRRVPGRQTFDGRIAKRRRTQHSHRLRLELVAEDNVEGLEIRLRLHVIALEVIQTAAKFRHETVGRRGVTPSGEERLERVHGRIVVRLGAARHVDAARRVYGYAHAAVLSETADAGRVLFYSDGVILRHENSGIITSGH